MSNKKKQAVVGGDGIDRSTDWVVTGIAAITALLFAAALLVFPETMDTIMTNSFHWFNNTFGWLWEMFIVVAFVICIWLVFGPLAKKRLGEGAPEMSNFKFYAMIFVFASSASIVYWVFIEWFYYLETPPFGAEAFGPEALLWASTYSSFHWGVVPFAGYALIGVTFAYYVYVQKKGTARVSAVCAGVIGEKNANGMVGKVIDAVFLVGIIISTAGYSLGVSVPIVGAFMHFVFGVDNNVALQTGIIVAVTIACVITMYTGLKKGMTAISTFRAYLFFIIAGFITVFGGNLVFIFNNTWESIGWQMQHIVQMMFYTDATGGSSWPQNWTIFFYIVFIAAMLSSGLYYAKLCKGRTIRESILAITLASALGDMVFFWTISNHSIATYLGDPATFKAAMALDPYNAIQVAIDAVPFSGVIMVAFLIYAFISTWTFAQSAIFSMAMVSQPNIPVDEEPTRASRMLWVFVTAILCVALLYIGGLQTVKNAILIAGIPGFILYVIAVISQWKDVKVRWAKDLHPDRVKIEQPAVEAASDLVE